MIFIRSIQSAEKVQQKCWAFSHISGKMYMGDEDAGDKTGLSVYSAYKGKQIKQKDGFLGKIIGVSDDYLEVKVLNGNRKNTITKIQLSFLLQRPGVYTIVS